MRATLGASAPAFEQALQKIPPVSIRWNTSHFDPPVGDPVPWCATASYLSQRSAFTLDPLFHAGAYYVQEASSMLLEQVFLSAGLAGRDLLALDLCAAPGGKSTHLRSLLSPGSLLVSNEVDGRRRSVLQENMWKWGHPNVVITGSTPQDLYRLPGRFDLILVDAPCSGEGMFRKDPFARAQWSPALVAQCVASQRTIVDAAWHALAPGGTIIYSTCTWEQRENEVQVAHLLSMGAEPIEVDLDPAWGVVRSELHGAIGHRCHPHLVHGEGFFIAAVRKPGTAVGHAMATAAAVPEAVVPWIRDAPAQHCTERDTIHFAVEGRWRQVLADLMDTMHVVAPGIPVAEPKGASLRPHAALALSQLLQPAAFQPIALELNEALELLRGHALPGHDAHGTALATYANRPLAWLQGAGTRWNNRWPAPWRIRKRGD